MSNPAYFCYGSVENVEALAGPSAVFVASYANLKDPAFQRAREKGAQVLVYRNLLHVPESQGGDEQREWFMGDVTSVPRWPYPAADGKPRSNWPGAQLIDIRPGSAWLPYMEDQLASLITSDLADGVFCDSHGARVWSSLAAWETWPVAEQTEWALGCVDTARRADAVRRQVNERFTIVHNGNWILPAAHPTCTQALTGERYCDGVCIEHHTTTQPFHVAYAAKPFNELQQRRVIVIANNLNEAVAWSVLPGVTHVASVDKTLGQNYQRAVPVPGIAYSDLRPAETAAYIARLLARFAVAQSEREDALIERDIAADQRDAAAAECATRTAERDAAIAECATRTAERNALVQACDVLDERLSAIAQIANAPR